MAGSGTRNQSKFDPRRRQPPAQADKVLATALRLFDVHGYSATTIEDIKLQSEVSVGVIYHHFGSKEGIAGALYVQSLHDFQRGLVRSIGLRKPGAERAVKAAVGYHLEWIDENRARAAFMLRRRETEITQANRSDMTQLNQRLFEEIELWYRPRVEAGEIRDLPLALLCSIWFGPTQEYARSVLDGPLPKRDTKLTHSAPALADAAWAALRPG
jgi:AcrR family transcriptional regulator